MTVMRTIYPDELDAFKRQWPCHGFPDALATIGFVFESNGDLVDIEPRDCRGYLLDSRAFDGPALLALSQDAQAKR